MNRFSTYLGFKNFLFGLTLMKCKSYVYLIKSYYIRYKFIQFPIVTFLSNGILKFSLGQQSTHGIEKKNS